MSNELDQLDNDAENTLKNTMSVNGESSGDDNICRDFLRNVCSRGKRCRYRHPEPEEAQELAKKVEYVFCHDFQNKECLRQNCKFLHCTKQEEDLYRVTGQLPQHVLANNALARGVISDTPSVPGEIPVCKDFMKGNCRRGALCRFRHIAASEYKVDMDPSFPRYGCFDRFDGFADYEPQQKRHAFDEQYSSVGVEHSGIDQQQQILPASCYQMLEEENVMLRHKVEELKKQVADLTATNEFLLDQNAQLRLSKHTTTVSPLSQPMLPHTISSAITQLSQQLPMTNSSLGVATAQTTMQPQRIAPELASQSMASIVPVTLGQGPHVSMAPVPVSMNQPIPVVSLSQNIHQSIITMSGPTSSLVSYPIMTRSMRPIPH